MRVLKALILNYLIRNGVWLEMVSVHVSLSECACVTERVCMSLSECACVTERVCVFH